MSAARPNVVTLHRPDAVSGVSSAGARFAPAAGWRPLVIGPRSKSGERSPLHVLAGCESLWWEDDADAVTQCLLLRDRLREMGAGVVVCNDSPLGPPAVALSAHRGMRCAAWVHGDDDDWDELMVRCGSLVDAWSGVNERIVERIRRAAPHMVRPTGVLTACVDVARVPSARRFDETLRLLYTGRIEKRSKRVLDLVRLSDALAARSVAFRLTIAGDGPAMGELADAAWPHVVAGRIDLIGAAPLAMIPALVRAHDMLLLVSRREGAPTSAMEAMAQGRPVAVSRGCGAVAECITDGQEGLLFDVGDMDALAARLAVVDRGWLTTAGSRAHALAMSRFSPAVVAPRAEALVRTAAESPMPTLDAPAVTQRWRAITSCVALAGATPRSALRRLATAWLDELGIADPGLCTDPPTMPSREGRMLLAVLSRLSERGLSRIALYGAGAHTRKLERVLAGRRDIIAVLDDRAGEEQGPPAMIGGVPVLRPGGAAGLRLDGVVVSSDEHQEQMMERARGWAGALPVVPIYEAA